MRCAEISLQGNAEEAQEHKDRLEHVDVLGNLSNEGQQLIDNGHVNAQLL
jgi:hypothetical protein